MKREQIEKIAKAMAALLGAVEGVKGMHVTHRDGGGKHLTFRCENDEDAQALAGAFCVVPARHVFDGEYYLAARVELDDLVFHITGPYHEVEKARELDDAKVDAAVAQARDAIGRES